MNTQKQGGGEVVGVVDGVDRGGSISQKATLLRPLRAGTKLYTAPPSAPVVVEGLVAAWEADIAAAGPLNKKDLSPARFVRDLRALAQQPAVDPLVEWGNRPLNFTATVGKFEDGAVDKQPAAVDGAMSPQVARDWLLELMGDHDFTLPTEAFDELVSALAAKPGGSDNDR